MTSAMKLVTKFAVCMGLLFCVHLVGQTQSPWERPAASLAEQIAGILGPGQARLTLRNQSSIPNDEIPVIRKLLDQDLKARGVIAAGVESANLIRVTLSEDARERLWVAEIVQGNETQVTMIKLMPGAIVQSSAPGGVVLRSEKVLTADEPVVGLIESRQGFLVAIEPEQLVIYTGGANGRWPAEFVALPNLRQVARDSRGIALAANGNYQAWLPGELCSWSDLQSDVPMVDPKCNASDDPWPIAQAGTVAGAITFAAFYNANRNYFTGVTTPSFGIDLPPFYSAAIIPRIVGGAGLLLGGVDGKVHMVDNGTLKDVGGARDWGSDFAALQSGCGAGTQVIASGSGEALNDSLRAYELPALEAVPAGAPLPMSGSVTAIWSATDGKSVYAVTRKAPNQYEVDRVSALCN